MLADLEAKPPATMRPADTVRDRRRCRAVGRVLTVAGVVVAVTLLVAGCGGGSANSPGVASVSTTNTSTSNSASSTDDHSGQLAGPPVSAGGPGGGAQSGFAIQSSDPQKALKFSECMRANGVANFPDPNGQGVIQGSGIDPSSPAFQKAQQKCAKYMGSKVAPSPAQQAAMEAAALKFSQCMRSHGEPDFPDPQFGSGPGGGVSIKIGGPGKSSSGLDPNSPIFQKAQQTCGSLLPGRVGTTGTKQ
jgi:hypothetical protein